ncbi:predicted protein [Streptomyces viridochromogenes DSM 40736]|uniref:Predicted protein n=2 Tax=Streptomyces viridochromogenes TaxID=1938 RepID=D9XBV2_STRVT|nr:predicted protein [Streptomyces viridochromogenes DSM 40736]
MWSGSPLRSVEARHRACRAMVHTDEVVPGEFFGIGAAAVAVAAAVTLGTSLVTARRTLRTPAIGAVAVA